MTEDWSVVAGQYRRQTGQSLRDVPLEELYDVGYAYFMDLCLRPMMTFDPEAFVKAEARAHRLIRETETDWATGLPTTLPFDMPSADQYVKRPKTTESGLILPG